MEVSPPIEIAFALQIINKFRTYSVCRNHCKHRNESSNEFPYVRMDLCDFFRDVKFPETEYPENLEWKVSEDLYIEFRDFHQPEFKEMHGFDIFFDMNGYRLLADLPITDLYYKRKDLEDQLDYDNEADRIEEIMEEIAEIDQETISCAKKLQVFSDWVDGFRKGMQEHFNECVVVVNDEGRFDFVEKDYFEDEKEERNWHLWNPVCKICGEEHSIEEDARMCEEEHIKERDEFYQEWLEKKEKNKLFEAGSLPSQNKLVI